MKVICPVCEKVVGAYVPKGGDGSAYRPYRHGACDGRFELVEEIYQERLPTMRELDGAGEAKNIAIVSGEIRKVDPVKTTLPRK